jgi:hypothetical protein
MNQNDMDRHYWRSGLQWSADSRSLKELRGEFRLPRRVLWLLLIALVVTLAGLLRLKA